MLHFLPGKHSLPTQFFPALASSLGRPPFLKAACSFLCYNSNHMHCDDLVLVLCFPLQP